VEGSKSSKEFLQTFSEFRGFGMQEIADQLEGHDIYLRCPGEVNLGNWFSDRVILIGDAAHAFIPEMPLGALLAIEDGYFLAKEIAASIGKSTEEESLLSQSLRDWCQRRKERIEPIRRETKRLALKTHQEHGYFTPAFIENWRMKWIYSTFNARRRAQRLFFKLGPEQYQ